MADQAILGEHVRQKSIKFISICVLSQFEDVERISVNLLKFSQCLGFQVEHAIYNYLSKTRAQLGKSCFLFSNFIVESKTVVLKARFLIVCKRMVPHL